MNKKPVAAVILAAGESRRMGQPKLLLPWQDGCVLDAVLAAVSAAPFDDAVLVSGAFRTRVEEVASSHGIRCIFNPDYALGQSTSLIAGLNALADDTAAMFILADQPGLSVTLLRRLIEAYQQSDAPVLQPRTLQGRSGHPVLFAPALFSELRTISGDVGGRPVLQAHKNEVRYLLTDDDAVWQDLDTPEDYRRLREKENG